MHFRDEMHGYQNRGVQFIKDTPFCGLWIGMGLGKTVSTATAVSDLMWDLQTHRCLIVAPRLVATTSWPMELQNWDHLRGLRFEVIHGNEKQRLQAVLKRADIHIISRDNLFWLWQRAGKKWPWDMVVLDESSSYKSQASRRWKAMRCVRRHTNRIVQLSAGPAPNGVHELWAPIFLLDQGASLGHSEKDFHNRWFRKDHSGYGLMPLPSAKEEIYEKISHLVMSMKAEDYLEMPELINVEFEVEMPAKLLAQYKRFEKDLLTTLVSSHVIEASNAAVLAGKLLQFANGALYTDNLRNWEPVHDEKIEALKEIEESSGGVPLLVAYNFKSDLARLKKAFPHAVVMDSNIETQHRWNAGKIPMLLVHPASTGHGLNLQGGSNLLVWFGMPWSLDLYRQLIGRLYRQGQKRGSVVVYHILTRGTIDYRVLKVLQKKGATEDELLAAVKAA